MGLLHNHARLRAVILGGALAATLALPAAASADTTGASISPAASRGATISVGRNVTVVAKIVATVEISFKCDPFMVFDWETGMTVPSTSGHVEFASATVVQVSGRSINSAFAEGVGGDVVCDGMTVHQLSIPVIAASMPWKSGTAVVGATVYVTDDGFQNSDYASSGPLTVKLGK